MNDMLLALVMLLGLVACGVSEPAATEAPAEKAPEGLVELSTLDLCDYDFAYAATEKANIIDKWNDLTVG